MSHNIINTIGERFADEGKKILEEIGDVTYVDGDLPDLKECTILVVGLGLNIDRDVIDAAGNLQIIATATTGLDHIDVEYAQNKGIKVLNLDDPEFLRSVTATAELAFCLLLSLTRRTHAAFDAVKKGAWQRERFEGHSLRGRTLGIIGLGRLGTMMAEYGKAFGMDVVSCDRGDDLTDLLSRSDAVSIHVPLNEETEKMIDADKIAQMKEGAVLINTARGQVVDEEAVIAALESGKLGGYATDVLANERSFGEKCGGDALVEYAKDHENVVITPHIGGKTKEAREATDIFIAKQVRDTVAS